MQKLKTLTSRIVIKSSVVMSNGDFVACSFINDEHEYRVTRRVFSEPVTSKLHLLYTKNLAGQLKTPKVIRISAMHANFSHSPVHSGPICFHMTKNLKLPSGTNKTK